MVAFMMWNERYHLVERKERNLCPTKHQRYDYAAGVEDNKFYMFTGGFKEMNNLAPHSMIERKANSVPPNINFSTLPGK